MSLSYCTSVEKCYLWRVEWGACGSLLFFPSLRITHLLLLLHIITSSSSAVNSSPFNSSASAIQHSALAHMVDSLYSKICASSPPHPRHLKSSASGSTYSVFSKENSASSASSASSAYMYSKIQPVASCTLYFPPPAPVMRTWEMGRNEKSWLGENRRRG